VIGDAINVGARVESATRQTGGTVLTTRTRDGCSRAEPLPSNHGSGQRLHSTALIADGDHARADAYVSLADIASAAVVAIGLPIATRSSA
jgi:hypothetical protein